MCVRVYVCMGIIFVHVFVCIDMYMFVCAHISMYLHLRTCVHILVVVQVSTKNSALLEFSGGKFSEQKKFEAEIKCP